MVHSMVLRVAQCNTGFGGGVKNLDTQNNDVFWLVLAIGAFLLGIVWGFLNPKK